VSKPIKVQPSGIAAKDLLRVAVTWEGQQIDQDLSGDVTFENNPEGLSRALAEQAGRFAWWAMLQVKARHRLATLERDLKVRRATVLIESKLKASAATVDVLKALVEVDPEVERLERAVIEADAELQATAVGRDSLKERRESLTTTAALMRQEMEQGLTFRTKEARQRASDYYRNRKAGADG